MKVTVAAASSTDLPVPTSVAVPIVGAAGTVVTRVGVLLNVANSEATLLTTATTFTVYCVLLARPPTTRVVLLVLLPPISLVSGATAQKL